MPAESTETVVGPVELGALATVEEMRAGGAFGPEHDVHAATIIAAARAVDAAGENGGKVAYSASVLAKLLDEWTPKPRRAPLTDFERRRRAEKTG